MSFSLSIVSEPIDFLSLSVFTEPIDCLWVIDFHWVYRLSPSPSVFQLANRWSPSPSIFSAYKFSMSLSILYEPIDFHWTYRSSVSLQWVSIVSEPIDLFSLLVFKEHMDSLGAYGFSLSLSIVSDPIVFLAYRFSMRLSIFSEPLDFHWSYRLSPRPRFTQPIGFQRTYRFSPSLWIFTEPIDFLRARRFLSLSVFNELVDFLWTYGLLLKLSIVSESIFLSLWIFTEPNDCLRVHLFLSLSVFTAPVDFLWAYGFSLTLSIFTKLSLARQIYIKELPCRISWHLTACQALIIGHWQMITQTHRQGAGSFLHIRLSFFTAQRTPQDQQGEKF